MVKALLVCVVGVLFSLQVLMVGLVAPTFAEMFIDFGSSLPLLTKVVLSCHYLWSLAGLGGIVWSIILLVWGRTNSRRIWRNACGIAIAAFVLGQILTGSLFVPVFHESGPLTLRSNPEE
jgi:type II secretory pathway component PulF